MFEEILFQIVRGLATVFEITLAFALLNGMFEPKYASKWPLRMSYVLLLAAVFFSNASLTLISMKTAVEILLVFLVSLLIFRGRLSIKIIYNLIFSIVLSLSDLLSAFALSFLPKDLLLLPTGDILYRLLEIVLPKMILFLFVMLLMLFLSRRKKNISLRYWVMLASVPLTTIVTLTVFQYYMAKLPDEAYMQDYIFAAIVGLVLINIMVFTLFARLQSQLEMRGQYELLEQQMALQKESIRKMESSYTHMRELRHDLNNHLLCMNTLIDRGEYEELKRYLKSMTATVEERSYVAISGNSAVDAILNEKLLSAQKKQINTSFEVCDLHSTGVQPMDLCIVLSNALDNAIEACEKIPDPTSRYLRLKIQQEDTFLVLSLVNPVETPPRRFGGLYLTDKTDRERHGFGLRSIRTTLEKYNGELVSKCEDKVFTIVIKFNF